MDVNAASEINKGLTLLYEKQLLIKIFNFNFQLYKNYMYKVKCFKLQKLKINKNMNDNIYKSEAQKIR